MPTWLRLPPTALTALLAACAASPPAVPVAGTAADIAALVGEWIGEYSSPATGRSGSISFTLSARGDTAHGDVVMIPADWGRRLEPWRDGAPTGPARPGPEPLTITFVNVLGDRVTGMLAPYADPATGARLVTSFDGRLHGDTVSGTFTTRVSDPPGLQTGGWRVVRQR